MRGIINNGRMRKLYLPAGGPRRRLPARARPGDDPGQHVQDDVLLDRLAGEQLHLLPGAPGGQALGRRRQGGRRSPRSTATGPSSPPAERAAFAFTLQADRTSRTGSPTPTSTACAPHYNDLQILEIITAVGGFNAMNRWTGALAIPQEGAPRLPDAHAREVPGHAQPGRAAARRGAAAAPVCAKPADRGPLETRAQVEAALDACRKRTPRLPLASEDQARGVLPADWSGSGPLPEWVRLLANFPKGGKAWVAQTLSLRDQGPAQPEAQGRDRLGRGPERPRLVRPRPRPPAAEGPRPGRRRHRRPRPPRRLDLPSPSERALALARKLTVDPALITDADIEGLRKHYLRPRGRRDRLPRHPGRVLRPADRGRRPAAGALKSREPSPTQIPGAGAESFDPAPPRSWPASLPLFCRRRRRADRRHKP